MTRKNGRDRVRRIGTVVSLLGAMSVGSGCDPDAPNAPENQAAQCEDNYANLLMSFFRADENDSKASSRPSGTRLVPSDVAEGDRFGTSVAIGPSSTSYFTAVVGAPRHDLPGATDAGAVYVFELDPVAGWTQTAKLVATEPRASAGFGTSVAIDVGRIVVGAPYEDDGSGLFAGGAYVFERGDLGWSDATATRLVSPEPNIAGEFGLSVASIPGTPADVAVGAAREYDDGRVHVFRFDADAWTATATLTGANSGLFDNFGLAVAATADAAGEARLWIGSPGPGGANETFGGVSRFVRTDPLLPDWTFDPTAGTPLSTIVGDRLGTAVSAFADSSGETVLAGAPRGGGGTGAALLRTGAPAAWQSLPRPDDVTRFGTGVAVAYARAYVGASGSNDDPSAPGTVHRFRPAEFSPPFNGPWTLQSSFEAPDGAEGDGFGVALAVATPYLVAGASGANGTSGVAGAAYVFDEADLTAPPPPPPQPPGTRKVKNTYLALRAFNKVDGPASGRIVLGRDLRPAFRWRTTVGSFDPKRFAPLANADVGIELLVAESEPREFARLTARFVPAGLEVSAATHAGGQGTPVVLDGATRAVFRLTFDGTEMLCEARNVDDAAFVQVARFAFSTNGRALRQCGQGSGLGARGEVGWDDSIVEATGPLPPPPTPEAGAAEAVAQAMDEQLAANAVLESGSADRAAPAANLAASLAKLGEARAAAEQLAAAAGKRRAPKAGPLAALRQIRRAENAIAAAAKLLAKGRSANRVTARVYRALRAEVIASSMLLP